MAIRGADKWRFGAVFLAGYRVATIRAPICGKLLLELPVCGYPLSEHRFEASYRGSDDWWLGTT